MTKDSIESVQLSYIINMLLWFEFALFTQSRDMEFPVSRSFAICVISCTTPPGKNVPLSPRALVKEKVKNSVLVVLEVKKK